jgi:hypothetical protein
MVFRHFINSNSYFPLELKRINEAIGPVIADIPFQRASPRVIYKSFSDEYSVPGLDFKLLSQKFVGKLGTDFFFRNFCNRTIILF